MDVFGVGYGDIILPITPKLPGSPGLPRSSMMTRWLL